MIKTPLRGRKDPLKFASLPTCGFVAQLVERPTSIWEARVQAPSKPEIFFSGFFFCNFFNCSLHARIYSSPSILSCVGTASSWPLYSACISKFSGITHLGGGGGGGVGGYRRRPLVNKYFWVRILPNCPECYYLGPFDA